MDILLETFKVIVPAFLAFVAGRYLKVFDRQKERDKETFDVFLKILPVTGGILYIVENHVSNGLDREGLSDLKNFVEYGKRPDSYFIDKNLEKQKLKLVKEIEDFLHLLLDVTVEITEDTKTSEPIFLFPPHNILMLREDNYYFTAEFKSKIDKVLHKKADQIYKTYSALIKEARKKL